MAGNESLANENGGQARRRAVMAVLAHSTAADIEGHLATIALPDHEDLREPENGLVMVRGRVGGDGAPFNLGEATVSRAAVRLSTGEVGFGYTLGRDREKARLIALCDAMVQSAELAGAIETKVVAPLRAAMDRRKVFCVVAMETPPSGSLGVLHLKFSRFRGAGLDYDAPETVLR
jgi:alpha-D-ribose 1-methylphosphonate 5-triphosphate synthase subunit PhnG